jgi:hypothetical protein
MKTGYKIAIGVVAGIGIGFLGFKIIMNKRKNDANDRATPDVQQELLIDQVLVVLKKENTEANRNIYRNKTIEELQSIIDNYEGEIDLSAYGYGDYGDEEGSYY